MNKTVYLAGPINACNDDEAITWREVIKSALPSDVFFRDPMVRDYRGQEKTKFREIVEADKIDIEQSDIVIAHCWKPSWGTSMEIFYAHQINRPVIAIVSENPSPWLIYHSKRLVPNLSEAIRYVRDKML